MKLIRLKMENFRQFLGKASLEFSVDQIKRVTVVHGENGVGKTTILNAIHWCLYGRVLSDFELPDNLVNDVAVSRNNETTARVELEFEHDDKCYRIERTYNQSSRKSDLQGFIVSGSNNTPIDGIAAVVHRIIPPTMAPYFFFHGEGLNNLGSGVGGANFLDAIRAILGFNHADKAIEHLKAIRMKWQKQHAKLAKLDSQAREALEQEVAAQEQLDSAENSLADAKRNLAFAENQLDEINQQIAELKVEDVAALAERRTKLERRERAIPTDLSKIYRRRIALISKFGWSLFGHSFLEQSANLLSQFRSDRKLPSEYNDRFVNSLLAEEVCICGTPLKEGSEPRRRVESMLAGASTSEQEDAIAAAIGIAENIEDVSDEYTRQVTQLGRNEQALLEESGSISRELEEIRARIEKLDNEKLNRLEAERSDISKLVSRLRDQKHLGTMQVEAAKKSLGEARRMKAKVVDIETLGSYQTKVDFIDRTISRLTEIIEAEGSTARIEIEEIINERLIKFSRKSYYAVVGDDFSFELRKQDGSPVAKSKGERALLNIAFISSLIQLARSRADQETKYFVQGTVAPFVIDAPFGELDNEYRGAVAEFLPESTEQLIVLLSSSHWGDVVESGLRPRIGREYILISESDADIDIGKTPDEIQIQGSTYACSRYGMDEPKTVVEPV